MDIEDEEDMVLDLNVEESSTPTHGKGLRYQFFDQQNEMTWHYNTNKLLNHSND